MTPELYIEEIKYKGEPCINMVAGKYTCIIAPGIGSNIIRLYDTKNQLELLYFNKRIPIKWLRFPSLVCGMPTLLFPNRLGKGKLKTSDSEYNFPINEEKLNNHIHGFLHKRKYNVVSTTINEELSQVETITRYTYDERDSFYEYFPVSFTIDITFTLNLTGLHYSISITNNSDKMLPAGLGCHTSMKAPFIKRGSRKNVRIQIPAIKRCELNSNNLCTGELLDLSEEDLKYTDGTKLPVLNNIDNDMFLIGNLTLDDGRSIHGIRIFDTKTKHEIIYEVDNFYKFFIIWNCGGGTNFFCPEPMAWMIDAPNLNISPNISGYKEISPGQTLTAWQHLSSK